LKSLSAANAWEIQDNRRCADQLNTTAKCITANAWSTKMWISQAKWRTPKTYINSPWKVEQKSPISRYLFKCEYLANSTNSYRLRQFERNRQCHHFKSIESNFYHIRKSLFSWCKYMKKGTIEVIYPIDGIFDEWQIVGDWIQQRVREFWWRTSRVLIRVEIGGRCVWMVAFKGRQESRPIIGVVWIVIVKESEWGAWRVQISVKIVSRRD